MDGQDKDLAAIAWFTGAWDDYLTFLPSLLPLIILQAAVSAAALPMIKAWHSLLPAAAYSVLVTAPLGLGCTLAYIRAARGERPRLKDLFAGLRVYPRALGVIVALGLLTVCGLLAYIIPGAAIYLTFCLGEHFAVDKGLSVRDSFAASRSATEGWRMRLLPMALFAALLSLFAPETFRVTGPLSTPAVAPDFRTWTILSHLLKTLVFGPWLGLSMARAYVFLLRQHPAEERAAND